MLSVDKIEALFGSDEAIGVMMEVNYGEEVLSIKEYDEKYGHLGKGNGPDAASLMPDGTSAVCCTNYAHHVRKVMGDMGCEVDVVGFANEDNPTSRCAIEGFHPEGHDFAIVNDRYLIDPWVRLVAAVEEQIFYDLNDPADAAKASAIYGPRECWLPLSTDDEPLKGADVKVQEIDLKSLPDVRHPHMIYTLEDAVMLAVENARTFQRPVPSTLSEVRDCIRDMQSRMDHQWLTGYAALDVLDAALDGRNIAKEGRLGCAQPEGNQELESALEDNSEIHIDQARDGKWNFRHDDNAAGPDAEYGRRGSFSTREEAIRAAFDEYGVEVEETSAARP